MCDILKRLWWWLVCRWFDRHAPGVDSEGWLCTRCGKRMPVGVINELYLGSESARLVAMTMAEDKEGR